MTFSERYEALERKFCERVQADFEELGQSSTLLRNIRPEGPVDFVLIAMEPSLGGGKSSKRSTCPPDWEEVRKREKRNFSDSVEDFILHFCIRRYLCRDTETYYVTDLSKGAMPVGKAPTKSNCRYQRWFPLLKEELRLVAKPGKTRIIAIGNDANGFLRRKNLCDRMEKILHYSGSAAGHRNKAIRRWRCHFPDFRQTVTLHDIEETVKTVSEQAGYSESSVRAKLKRIREGSGLTESRKKLIFHYKNRFEELRTTSHIVLRV